MTAALLRTFRPILLLIAALATLSGCDQVTQVAQPSTLVSVITVGQEKRS